MTQQTRATIKSYFNTDDTPIETQFADFIDTSIDGVAVTYTTVVVAAAGGDYTTIAAALAAISGQTESNRYRILVAPGSYSANQLILESYIDIIGANAATVTVTSAGVANQSLIENIAPNCIVSGLTLVSAVGGRYVVHADTAGEGIFTLRDCVLTQNNAVDAIGGGGRPNQVLHIENCSMNGDIGIHGVAINREAGKPWQLNLIDVTAPVLNVRDFLEYERNSVVISGGAITTTNYSTDTSYYDDNPGNPLYNRGWQMKSIYVIEP